MSQQLPLLHSGKVRDTYDLGSDLLLQVASDRVSVRDVVLGEEIPGKGKLLTQMTMYWMATVFPDIRNHLVHIDMHKLSKRYDIPDLLGRGLVVERCDMVPIECIVRGHLFGSVVKEYEARGTVCGMKVPAGLKEGDRFEEPIFTTSTKAADGDHDVNIAFDEAREVMSAADFDPDLLRVIEALSLRIYREAAAYAAKRDIIIADTKLEWGLDSKGNLTLCDEVLTPDSSRFWDRVPWEQTGEINQLDKQTVRDYYGREHPDWNWKAPAPPLPDDVIRETMNRYEEVFARLLTPPVSSLSND